MASCSSIMSTRVPASSGYGMPSSRVLAFVPARAHADLDPAAAHLVHGRHELGERARDAERHRRHQRAQLDAASSRAPGPPASPRHRWCAGPRGAREAGVVVGAEEALEAGRLGSPRDGQDLEVARAPAGARS